MFWEKWIPWSSELRCATPKIEPEVEEPVQHVQREEVSYT